MNAATTTVIIAASSEPGPPLDPTTAMVLGCITIGIIVVILVLCVIEALRD